MYIKKTGPLGIASACLALAATATAASLSILAGWQRGGLPAERIILTAVGVVLVVGAHLLPALCRPHGWRLRMSGAALWLGCMAATCYGHAAFFVTAQTHAGELRAKTVAPVAAAGRALTEIALERARVIARLAYANERRCAGQCASVRIERTTLAARIDALDAEKADMVRRESAADQATVERTTAKVDPIVRLLGEVGLPASGVQLAAGMTLAVVVEALACFCWLLVLRPNGSGERNVTAVRSGSHASPSATVTAVTEVMDVRPMTDSPTLTRSAVTFAQGDAAGRGKMPDPSGVAQADEISRVLTAIGKRTLRPTVSDIRRYLGCSQAKAAAVRRRVVTGRHEGINQVGDN